MFAPNELPSLIEAIFLSKDEGDTIHRLLRDDAQSFVDVLNEARLYPLTIINASIEIEIHLGTG